MKLELVAQSGFLLLGTYPSQGDILEAVEERIHQYEMETYGDSLVEFETAQINDSLAHPIHVVMVTGHNTYIVHNLQEIYDGEVLDALSYDISILQLEPAVELSFKFLNQ